MQEFELSTFCYCFKVAIGKWKGCVRKMNVAAGIGLIMATVIITYLSKIGLALKKSDEFNAGYYLLSVNGASLAGLSILYCIQHIKVQKLE